MSHQTLSLIATTAREKQWKKSVFLCLFCGVGGLTFWQLFCFFKQTLFFFLNGLNYFLWSAVNLSYVAIYGDRCCYYWQKVLIMVIFLSQDFTNRDLLGRRRGWIFPKTLHFLFCWLNYPLLHKSCLAAVSVCVWAHYSCQWWRHFCLLVLKQVFWNYPRWLGQNS